MDVVVNRVDNESGGFDGFENGGDVCVEFRADGVGDERVAVFGGVNQVDGVFGE